MLRMAFLIVVVLGALGIVLSLIVGAGVFRAARLRSGSTASTETQLASAKAASSASPQSANTAASSSAKPQTPQAAAEKNPAAPAPAAPVNVAPIVLLAKDAELHGEDIRLAGEGNAKTLVNWSNRFEMLEWVVTIPKSGEYAIDVEYSADPAESGGAAQLMFGADPRGLFGFMPTAGWNDFKTARVRTMLLPEGKTSVLLRPIYIMQGRELMHLRSIRLTLLRPMEVQSTPDRGRFRMRRGLF